MGTRLHNRLCRVLSLPPKAAVPLCAAYVLAGAFLALHVPAPQSAGGLKPWEEAAQRQRQSHQSAPSPTGASGWTISDSPTAPTVPPWEEAAQEQAKAAPTAQQPVASSTQGAAPKPPPPGYTLVPQQTGSMQSAQKPQSQGDTFDQLGQSGHTAPPASLKGWRLKLLEEVVLFLLIAAVYMGLASLFRRGRRAP